MNFAQALALWLSMYASIEGKCARVRFPGNIMSWTARCRQSTQDTVAHLNIHASLQPAERVAGRGFNAADKLTSWSSLWPQLCAYFGLEGTGPDDAPDLPPTGTAWIRSHYSRWTEWESEHNLKPGILETTSWEFMEINLTFTVFDRELDVQAARGLGFQEELDPMEGYRAAFERMRVARVIP
jgi:hypothetical protein